MVRKATIIIALIGVGILGYAIPLSAQNSDKITICHAAGRDGTTKYVTLTLAPQAVFGPGGHFNENGTTQAGHEQDYMGPCQGDTTETTTTTTESTTTNTETTTTDTTEETTTTSTTEETTTTSEPPTTEETTTTTTTATTEETTTTPTTTPTVEETNMGTPKVSKLKKDKVKIPKPCPVGKPFQGRCAVQGNG